MISKISFSKLVRDEMRKLNWLFAVQLLLFGLLIPFRVLVVMAVRRPEFFNNAKDEELLRTFYTNIGLDHPENTFFILVAGTICALCAFSYVHSAEKLDFFHSLPIKRERLFAAKYLGSVLTFVAAYGISQAAALVIGAVYGVCSARVIFEMLAASAEGILCFLCAYSGGLLAVMLTGKLLTTFLAVGVLGLYFPMLWILQMGMREVFYDTALYYPGTVNSSESILTYTSPWAFAMFRTPFDETMRVGLTGRIPDMAELCQLVAMAAVFSLAALMLYRVRKTEAAGSAVAFKKTEGIVKLLLTIPSALLAAFMAFTGFYSPVWEMFFIVLFGVLACMILEFIYRGDIRQAFSHKSHMVITVVVSAVLFFCIRYDVTGFNTYLPAQDEVQSMAVNSGEFGFRYSMTPGWEALDTEREILDYLETENFAPIYELAENGAENAALNSWDETLTYVDLKYYLKSGKEIYRHYWVDRELYFEKMDKLQQDESFREKLYPILTWENTDHLDYIECTIGTDEMAAWGIAQIPETVKGQEYDAYIEAARAAEAGGENPVADGDSAVSVGKMTDAVYDTDVQSIVETTEDYAEDVSAGDDTVLHVSGKDMERLVEAYRSDLSNVTYSELCRYEASMTVWSKGGEGDYYRITSACTETIAVIRDIYNSQND